MKNSLVLVVLFFTIWCCNAQSQTQKNNKQNSEVNFTTILLDSFKVTKDLRIGFLYHDSLANGHPVSIASKETQIALNAPAIFTASDKNQTPFLIYPSEKIRVRYELTDTMQLYIPENEERTNELNFFRQLIKETGYFFNVFDIKAYQKKINTVSELDVLEKEIINIENKRLKFLNWYKIKYPISDYFFEMASKTINSAAIYDSILLYRQNMALLKRQMLMQKLISQKLIAINNLGFMPYKSWFVTCKEMMFLVTEKNTNSIATENDFIKNFNFVTKNFYGTTKDFLLSNLLYAAKQNDIVIPKEYIVQFNKQCKDIGYRKLINKKLEAKPVSIDSKGANKLLLADGKSIKDMDWMISKFKGKIILLDFWASWCVPCREEMPHANKLKKKYKNSDVVFVNISTDKEVDNWLKANKEENLADEFTFLLLNASRSPFTKRYAIHTIPHYILIDKSGKVVDENAPRPSDLLLADKIDKFLLK